MKLINGEFNLYFPLYIESNNEDYLKSIENLDIVISELTEISGRLDLNLKDNFKHLYDPIEQTHIDKICNGLSLLVKERKNNNSLKDISNKLKSYIDSLPDKEKFEEIIIILSDLENEGGVDIKIFNQIVFTQYNATNRMVQTRNKYLTVYGPESTDVYYFVLLYPIKIRFNNGNIEYASVYLTVYKYNMAVIKVSIPFRNIKDDKLKKNDINGYFSDIELAKFISLSGDYDYSSIGDNYIEIAISMYISYLKEKLKRTFISLDKSLHTVILETDSIPKEFSKVNNTFKDDFYRIVCAPLDEIFNIKEDAQEFWNNSYYGLGDIRHYFSSVGKCYTLISKNLLDKYLKDSLNIVEYMEALKESLDFGVDFPMVICILEKMNSTILYQHLMDSSYSLEDARSKYMLSKDYIINLQSNCYGTVYDMIRFMKRIMVNYFKDDILQSKIDNMEVMISFKKERSDKRISFMMSFLGAISVLVFALPIIKDSLIIIKEGFKINDIPFITIDISTIAIWILLIVFFVAMLSKLHKESRRRV